MAKEHTSEEIKYRLSDLGKQIGNIAINYITKLENENADLKKGLSVVNASNSFNKEQLTEANKIILTLLNTFAYPIGREDWTMEDIGVINRAEKFIKE